MTIVTVTGRRGMLPLLITIALGLTAPPTGPDVLTRAGDPAPLVLTAISVLFLWSGAAGTRRHPYGWLFRTLIRPRLAPPAELEDPFGSCIGCQLSPLPVRLRSGSG